ncbi:MAG: DUF3794 domain-containing protein [Cellulosilyticaceae bacterium]
MSSFIERYSNITKGALTYTGNSLGFSLQPYGWSGVGAFIATDPNLSVAGYPTPSTMNWQQNGSWAILNMPVGSTVLYAELVWGGSTINDTTTLTDPTLNTPITFTTSQGTYTIAPDPATAINAAPVNGQVFYTRSQNVTQLVQAAGAGTYQVNGVPAAIEPSGYTAFNITAVGWTLAVAYANNNSPYSELDIYVGNYGISFFTPPVDTTVTGFLTPLTGSFSVRLLISAMQGDPGNEGDTILFGPNTSNLTALSGPNNPVNNFFRGQINNDQGLLDTSGDFGTLNQPPPPLLQGFGGVRTNWDITNVDATAAFVNNQSQANFRIATNFDVFAISTFAFQIQVVSPDIAYTKSAPTQVIAGAPIAYTLSITNNGQITTDNFLALDTAAAGTSINIGSITVSGATGPIINTSTPSQLSVEVGPIAPNQTVVISYAATTTTATPTPILNTADSHFTFTPAPGQTLPVTQLSNTVSTIVISADLSVTKTINPSPVVAGQLATYTVAVHNAGPSDAQNVSLADDVPSGLLNPVYSLDGGTTWLPLTGTINVGTVTAGATTNVLVRGTVSPSVTTPITNEAVVTSPIPDPNPNNNATMLTTPVNTSADVSITGAINPTPAVAGSPATYTFTVKNAGPSVAQNVTVTDPVPASILNPQYSLDNGATWSPWPGSLNLGALPPAGTSTLLIRGTVAPGTTGTITNTAKVATTTPESDPSNNTAIVTAPVNTAADISVTKTASPNPAVPGTSIQYVLAVSNAGPSDAQGVVVADTLSSSIASPQYSLNNGTTWFPWTGSLAIGTVNANTTINVLIKGTLSPIFVGPIDNTATVSSPTLDPNPNNNTATIHTPTSPSADVKVTNTLNTTPVVAGGPIQYTVITSNLGPSTAQNVVLSHAVPASIQNPQYSTDGGVTWQPWTGSLPLGSINPGNNQTILIKGTVSPTATGTLTTTASASSPTPDPNLSNNTAISTAPITTSANLSITKIGSPNPVEAGAPIVYTVTLTNAGPSDALETVVTDTLSSLLLNPQYSLDNGTTWSPWIGTVSTGTVAAKTSKTILIKAIVSSDATGGLKNTATVASTTPNPNPGNTTATTSNLVSNVQVVKTSTRTGVAVGDTVTYLLKVINKGEVTAEQVILSDPLPPEVAYADNLHINGAAASGNITQGITLGNIAPNTTVTVAFDVKVLAVPTDKTIDNQAIAKFSYRKDPTSPAMSGQVTSPVNQITVYNPSLTVTKVSDATAVAVGDTFIYTITAQNSGDIILNKVVVTDALPAGFVVQSIQVDDKTVSGNIQTGLDIGTLNIGQTRTILLTILLTSDAAIKHFDNTVKVIGLAPVDPKQPAEPVEGDATDKPGIDLYDPNLVLVKSADKHYAVVGDIITYTVTATNKGSNTLNNLDLDQVILHDLLPSELVFESGSITLDSVSLPDASILTGVNLGTLLVNQTKTLTFKAQVVSATTLPVNNAVTGEYQYLLPGRQPQTQSSKSNTFQLSIKTADLVVNKSSHSESVNLGDTITYTLIITNAGTLDASNVLVQDHLPAQVTLVPRSVTLNGVTLNGVSLSSGITIPHIAVGETVTITYQVRVTGSNCSSVLVNQASVTFTYHLPDGSKGTKTESNPSASTTVDLQINQFKQMSIESYLAIPTAKPDIEAISSTSATIDILATHVIATPVSKNIEGQQLTGYKAIVKGILHLVIVYTALDADQSVHSAHYSIPFSTFVILPFNYQVGSKLESTGEVEDIYYNAVDTRNFFVNITTLINLKALGCLTCLTC